jgi:spermidine/putrescine transport system substrate-binding protein
MKKIALVLLSVLMLAGIFTACGTGDYTATINVYNWGVYISDGSDGYIDVNKAFTEATGIKVNYTTFDSNETLYTKLKSGGVSYDVIVPSDYMIGALAAEGLLLELDYSNIPNYQYVDESFRGLSYDPEEKYTVPYTWGTVGLIYNTKYVTKPVDSWSLMWDEDYAGKILMFDNPRDSFAIAELLLGYDVNTTDETQLQACADKLAEQKELVQSYVMDQVFAQMENEEAWVAAYYAGDYLLMRESNEDLAFCFPKEGFNLFVDAFCIPTCSRNKALAEQYINFLTSPEISGENMSYLGYSTPLTAARQYLEEDVAASEIAYPSAETLSAGVTFDTLPTETSNFISEAFNKIKASGSGWSVWIFVVIGAVLVAAAVLLILRKKKRNKY